MKNLFYFAALGILLTFTGCGDKKDDPQSKNTGLDQVRIVVTGAHSNIQNNGNARVSLSKVPIRTAVGRQIFMSQPVYVTSAQNGIDDNKWDKVDFTSNTLYVSLYYQDVLRSGYTPPVSGDKTEVSVVVEGKVPVRLLIDASTFNDASLRWRDSEGKTHVGKEASFIY